MSDQKKTKAQLIEELEASRGEVTDLRGENTDLREKVAGVDVSAVERQLAVERVRTEAMNMRSTEDLRRVVAVLFQGMLDLGIETPGASIFLVDEASPECRSFSLRPHPRLAGLDWSPDRPGSEGVAVAGDNIIFAVTLPTPTGALGLGEDGETRTRKEEIGEDIPDYFLAGGRALGLSEEELPVYLKLVHGHWFVTNVPFRYGMIGYREREHHTEHDQIIADLARGLELGFLRFLDFQKVESQNRELTIQNALERLRARALGMQKSEDLLGVVSLLSEEYRGLGIDVFASTILVPHEEEDLVENYVRPSDRADAHVIRTVLSETLNDVPSLKEWLALGGKVRARFAKALAGSASGKVRAEWAEHLEIAEEDLLEMLEHFEIRPCNDSLDRLHEQCTWLMQAVGFRGDREAVDIGVAQIRRLIGTGVRVLDADSMLEIGQTKGLLAGKKQATLLVQSLEPDPWPEAATAAVDWVDLFEGEDAYSRRQLREPDDWNMRLKPDLRAAVADIRRLGYRNVFLAGTLRLSTGLLAEVELSEVAGFSVALRGREGEWSSTGERVGVELRREEVELGAGDDVALCLSVSAETRSDVLDYIRSRSLPVGRLIDYSPSRGASRDSIVGPQEGLGLACRISAEMRTDTQKTRGVVHIFQAAPLPLSVMIGHFWNRMPRSQLYDDLGPGCGYAATFLLER